MSEDQHFELWEILELFLFMTAPVFISGFAFHLLLIKRYSRLTAIRIFILFLSQFLSLTLALISWFYLPFSFDIMVEWIFLPLLFIEIPLLLFTYLYYKKS